MCVRFGIVANTVEIRPLATLATFFLPLSRDHVTRPIALRTCGEMVKGHEVMERYWRKGTVIAHLEIASIAVNTTD